MSPREAYEMGKVDEDKKPSGVSYTTLVVVVIVVMIVCAGICAAVVVPLLQNKAEGEKPTVQDPVTSTQKPVTSSQIPVTSTDAVTPIADTQCGMIQGVTEGGVYVFKGIPYAEPPTGNLRWKPPVAISPDKNNCWNETKQTTEFGNACFQTTFESREQFRGAEDCLYLNVWTPSLATSAQLPVMVWIHGGSLESLSGNDPFFSPNSRLCAVTQAVYVSMNYRLNVFGFLALDILSATSATNTSGNYGFLDQLLALTWVQDNIRNFGGDPSLVTVFGQSSGGTSILALLASPLSQGLFHRAWLMSASPVMNRSLADASDDNLVFLRNTGCDDINCLLSLTPENLTLAIPWDEWPNWAMADLYHIPTKGQFNGALAIIDGHVLTEEPFDAFRAGRGMSVPVLLGNTAQEVDIEPPESDVIRSWTWENYTSYVREKLQPFGTDIVDRALELYPPNVNITPEFQLTSLITDLRVTCPTNVLASALSASSYLRVFRYIVTSYPAHPLQFFGSFEPVYAFHSWDSMVLFGVLGLMYPSQENFDFQRNQEREVMYFARHGIPYSPSWMSYPNSTVKFSGAVETVTGYKNSECQLWLDNGFFSYGWIN